VVLCITGHGLKTAEAVAPHLPPPRLINPSLREFDALVANDTALQVAAA
jgi:threonine synthase